MTRKDRIDRFHAWLLMNMDHYQWFHSYLNEYSYISNLSVRTLKEYAGILQSLGKIHVKPSFMSLKNDEFQLTVLPETKQLV